MPTAAVGCPVSSAGLCTRDIGDSSASRRPPTKRFITTWRQDTGSGGRQPCWQRSEPARQAAGLPAQAQHVSHAEACVSLLGVHAEWSTDSAKTTCSEHPGTRCARTTPLAAGGCRPPSVRQSMSFVSLLDCPAMAVRQGKQWPQQQSQYIAPGCWGRAGGSRMKRCPRGRLFWSESAAARTAAPHTAHLLCLHDETKVGMVWLAQAEERLLMQVHAGCQEGAFLLCRAPSMSDQAGGPQWTQRPCCKHLVGTASRLSTAGRLSSCMQTQVPQLTESKAPGVCAADHGAVGVLELSLHPHSGQSA